VSYSFEKEVLNDDCTTLVVCVANNSFGESKQHFNLTPSNSDDCPSSLATSPSSRPITVTVDQISKGSGDPPVKDSKAEDTTFKIIIGAFAVAVTAIVVGVLILLIYFVKHFSHRKKDSEQLTSVNPCTSGGSFSHCQDNPDTSITSSLRNDHTPCAGGSVYSNECFICSGASVRSMTPQPYLSSKQNTAPSSKQLTAVDMARCGDQNEGIYHRLNHNLPHNTSCSSLGSSAASHSKLRLASLSSANSTSPLLLSSQQSTSDLEDSVTGTGGLFFTAEQRRRGLPRQLFQPPLSDQQQPETSAREVDATGMVSNPAYEPHKLKISTDKDEPPHVYERVA
jgi:hypothetical protein